MSDSDARERVLAALANGSAPEDIYVVVGGLWVRVGELSDPVLRFLCLQAIRELQRETTTSTGVPRA